MTRREDMIDVFNRYGDEDQAILLSVYGHPRYPKGAVTPAICVKSALWDTEATALNHLKKLEAAGWLRREGIGPRWTPVEDNLLRGIVTGEVTE